MEALLAEKEAHYLAQVEEAKKHMLEASEFVHKKLKEGHQAMFKDMMNERHEAYGQLGKAVDRRDKEEASEL